MQQNHHPGSLTRQLLQAAREAVTLALKLLFWTGSGGFWGF